LPGALKLETNDSENKTKQNEKQNKTKMDGGITQVS
jgi:hypothetical protein